MTQVIDVRELSFAYRRNGPRVIDDLSHTFRRGKVTALTGPSGRGKSTLLYLLGLMLKPTSGTVIIDGIDAGAVSDRVRAGMRAENVGFVFQDAALDVARPVLDSVLEPALYHPSRARRTAMPRARDLLAELGVSELARHRPGEVSGGQGQRVALCRALITDPPIVLADEPTGNLDRSNAEVVLRVLAGAAHEHGRCVIIATHDPFVLSRADEALEL